MLGLLAVLLTPSLAHAFRIVEFNLGCASGDRAPMWVQLDGRDFDPLDGALGIQTYDRDGVLIVERRRIFGSRSGSIWFPGERWFYGTSECAETYTDFENATPFPPNATMLAPMDTLAGRIVLFRLEGTTRIPLQTVTYGPTGDIEAPPPGSSAILVDDQWRWNPTPIVRRYDGFSFSGSECLRYPRFAIRELMLACEDGDTRGGFLELEALGVRPRYDARIQLRAYDRFGALLGELTDLFGARAGESCATGSRYLLASAAFEAAAGATVDHVLPFALDPLAGRIELSGTFLGTPWMLDSLSYDRRAGERPPDGLALEHAPLSRLVTLVAPSPTTSAGDTLRVPECAFGSRAPAPFVQEIALRCADGGLDGQFVELSARDGLVTLRGTWWLRAYAHSGARAFDLPLPEGITLTPDHDLLVTADAPLTWPQRDATLPAALDTLGGRVELLTTGTSGDSVVSALAWGGDRTPPAGTSLGSNGRSRTALQAFPSPTDLTGRTFGTGNCLAGTSPHAYVVSEVGTHCQDGSSDGLFVELASDSLHDTYDPALGLRLRSPSGATLATCFPLFALAPRGERAPGSRWLVTAAGFAARNALAPDAVLDTAPDAGASVISVFRRNLVTGADSTLSAMAVSVAPPPPGRSIVRGPDGVYGASGVVTPTRADGAVVAPGACYVRAQPEAVQLHELFLRCREGGTGARYVELLASSGDASYAPDLIVRVFDHAAQLTGVIVHPFGALEGQPWRADRPFLLGGEQVQEQLGLVPDAPLPVALDTLGGRIQLLLAGGEGGLVLDELRWGTSAVPVPEPGASLVRDGESWREQALPSPANRDRDGVRVLPCLGTCPPRTVRMAFGSDQLVTSARASLSSFETRAELDATRGAWSIEAGFDETRAVLPDRFILSGTRDGAPTLLRARLEFVAQAAQRCDSLGPCSASRASVALRANGHADSVSVTRDTTASVVLEFMATPGEPFELVSEGRAIADLTHGFRAALNARLVFELPVGARITSCYGYDSQLARGAGEPSVAATASEVRIAWPVLDPATFRGTVERRAREGDWIALEERIADADGVVRFGDRRAEPGVTYEYRLVWDDVFGHQVTPAVTVRVPARASFGLLGARPNPSRGALRVAFELAEPGDARLEILDVSGRVVARMVQSLAAGSHAWPVPGALAPGVYVIRLHTAGHNARTTAI
ncbi:MAG: T9SS type A sorting domain-containing protein, partial [Candidatus Eisenbacteria bacterium]|nr:T9SS type A sorting domain-containing protein [Candidatus Eisenbacteria bacterium]